MTFIHLNHSITPTRAHKPRAGGVPRLEQSFNLPLRPYECKASEILENLVVVFSQCYESLVLIDVRDGHMA